MAELRGKLIEVFQLGNERAGVADLPAKYRPHPGQYLPCRNLSREVDIMPINLFKVIGPKGALSLGSLSEVWMPGDELVFLLPQGHGFHLPAAARRVGLMAVGISPIRMLTLVDDALSQDAAVTLFCDPAPSADILDRLPPAVEVGPVSSLREDLSWPDYLAAEVRLEDLPDLPIIFGQIQFPFMGQVLIRTAMPCRGLGACGVCAVETRRGWKYTCQDGPVFPIEEVFNVA
jgi:hypothetical protein